MPGWLDQLPETVRRLSERWEITFDSDIPGSYVTLVLLGYSPKLGPVIFKSSPLTSEFRAESTALSLAGGERVSRLFDLDLNRNAMIVERIMPGTQLRNSELSDSEATRVFAARALGFWADVEDASALHGLREWMRELFSWKSRPDRIHDDLVRLAQTIGLELLDSKVTPRLVHGDLQHHNILQRSNGDWIVIDPKGVWGDPAFEIAAWMYNPPGVQKRPDYVQLAEQRFDIVSSIWGIDRQHLIRWAFVGAVLSAVWSAGDPAPEEWLNATRDGAEILRTLLT